MTRGSNTPRGWHATTTLEEEIGGATLDHVVRRMAAVLKARGGRAGCLWHRNDLIVTVTVSPAGTIINSYNDERECLPLIQLAKSALKEHGLSPTP